MKQDKSNKNIGQVYWGIAFRELNLHLGQRPGFTNKACCFLKSYSSISLLQGHVRLKRQVYISKQFVKINFWKYLTGQWNHNLKKIYFFTVKTVTLKMLQLTTTDFDC